MNRKLMLIISVLVVLTIVFCVTVQYLCKKMLVGYPVRNINTGLGYTSIQEAIDASATSHGHTIFVKVGTYYEPITVHKSISLIGENTGATIIDGNGTGTVVDITHNITAVVCMIASNANISGFTIRNGGFHGIVLNRVVNCTVDSINSLNNTSCVSLMDSNGNLILNSKFSNGTWGIVLVNSTDNEIIGNLVTENLNSGIVMGGPKGSSMNLIANNTVSYNGKLGYTSYGYGFDIVGCDNEILYNNISDNNNGIVLDMAHRNQIKGNNISNNTYFAIKLTRHSSNNTLFGNTVRESGLAGLLMDYDTNNFIHHNNFINNKPQVASASYETVWDDGIEGNYWSDYASKDNNRDGIGDVAYMVYEHYRDEHPLMGRFSAFNAMQDAHVNVISNSTVERFEYIESNNTIKIHISNMTITQTFGFCRICIPHSLINPFVGLISVSIDNGQTPVLFLNYSLYNNGTHRWMYFAYENAIHEIAISQELTSNVILLYNYSSISTLICFSFALFCELFIERAKRAEKAI